MKIDLHIHTKYSIDSVSEPEKIMKYAIKRGLDGIAVADHNTTKGWKDMLDAGKKFGLEVVLGEEIIVKPHGKSFEILVLFVNETIKSRNLDDIFDEVKTQDGIVCVPHPFDPIKGISDNVEELIKKPDAIEVYNARCPSEIYNKKAFNFAKKHDLGMTAGSDAHTVVEVGNAYVLADVNGLEGLKHAILKREIKIIGRLMNPTIRLWSWFNQGISVFR